MSYTILHMQKLKQPALKGIQIHNQREKESQTNPDIDEFRTKQNYDLVNSTLIDYNEKINKMIEDGIKTNKAVRKDAVKVASFLVTSDSKFFEDMSESVEREFFATAYDYFCEEYGKKNIAYAMVHKDEKTPHMHVGFVPITEDGRLSAKDFFGKKQQLVELQDKFHQHMLEAGFDLERGVSSDKKHIETARFKAETFVRMEEEAKVKYEKTMDQLNEIEDRVQKVEEIATKKVPMYGRVIKEEDYETLKEHAKASVKYKVLTDNLQEELEKSQQEVAQLKADKQKDHDQVRGYYQEIQKENEHLKIENKEIKADLERLADKKAEKMAKEKINNSDIVKRYKHVVTQYKELGEKAEDFRKKANDVVDTKELLIKDLTTKMDDLKSINQFYQNENKKLESINKAQTQEINSLKSKIQEFQKQFVLLLNAQLNRVKTFLNIRNVDRKTINALEEDRDKFVGESFSRYVEQTQKRQREKQYELER